MRDGCVSAARCLWFPITEASHSLYSCAKFCWRKSKTGPWFHPTPPSLPHVIAPSSHVLETGVWQWDTSLPPVVKGQVAQRWKPCPCTSCLTYLSNQFKVKGDRETRAISPVLIEVERWLNSGLPGQNDAVTDELTDWFVCSATEHRCFNYYWQTISNKVQYNWQCSSSPCATEKFLNISKQLPRTFVILVIYISISVCLQSLGTKRQITGLNDWSFGNIRTTALYFAVYVYIKIKDV